MPRFCVFTLLANDKKRKKLRAIVLKVFVQFDYSTVRSNHIRSSFFSLENMFEIKLFFHSIQSIKYLLVFVNVVEGFL